MVTKFLHVIRIRAITTKKMNGEQDPPPLIDQIQFRILSFNEKVMFVYPYGGRSVICRCLATCCFAPDCTSKKVYDTLRSHISYQHKERKVSASGASASILNLQLLDADDIPVI